MWVFCSSTLGALTSVIATATTGGGVKALGLCTGTRDFSVNGNQLQMCSHQQYQQHQATHLIDLKSRTTLCQPIYTGLIGLLVKLVFGSIGVVRTLFELNIISILKDILSTYDFAHGMSLSNMADGHCNQVHEVLKLLNKFLPTIARDQDGHLALDKEAFLWNRPDLLEKFGMDILPVLIQQI
ncbi:hypothetical protein F0562_019434 [Nyssa sinensis]|uniref:Uncharacterized protein n=1 Tax=Nyssa sinensis TaxID=561372 RepID=A0A5J5BRG3_9ASTE|nr:hypothetical protein F0562_019434 [Nyssa sinensis]